MKNTKKYILEIIEYIEDNINDINICKISEKFNISKFYLNRIFSNITNTSLAKYIRSRKLVKSLFFLDNSSYRIIDIAMMLDFKYEQSFIRAFKNEFNITPHQYRKNKPVLNIMPKLTLFDLHIIENGLLLSPKNTYFPEINLIGKTYYIEDSDIDCMTKANKVGINFILEESKMIKGEVDTSIYYSIVELIDEKRGLYRYTPSLSYTGDICHPDDMKTMKMEPREYITFKYIGNHPPTEINRIILEELHTYIEANFDNLLKDKCKPNYKIERVDRSICSEDYCEFEFLFPII